MAQQDSIPHRGHRLDVAVGPVGQLTVVSPFEREPIATVDTFDGLAVDAALARANALYSDRAAWLPVHRRRAILMRAADLLAARTEELALQAAREGGKPLLDSRVEIERAVDGLLNCAELLRSSSGREIPMGITPASEGRMAFTHHEPIGVVVAVSAFNHPFNLIVHQVGPAVAAGCPVIVKPAEDTPLSCYALIDLLHEAGLPPGWVQGLMTDGHRSAEQLVTDPRVGFFSFVGSARVGWHLRSRLAPGTRCALEHGGAAPVIVDQGVDLDTVVPTLAKGGFYHAGQVCVSVQRVFVHVAIADELARRLSAAADAMHVGDPVSADTEVGPLIRPAEVERIAAWVDEAVAGGAVCLAGGNSVSATCYAPTVLFAPPIDAAVSRREIFGPVVCVYPYRDAERAIEQANALPYAFQAGVFTERIGVAMDMATKLAASAVMINDHTAFRVDWMPFAGLRESGLGIGGIPFTFEDMQVEKMIVIKT